MSSVPVSDLDRADTEMLFQDYFLAAGVSEAWLSQLLDRP